MPPRRKPTKDEIRAIADRAEGKKPAKKKSSPLDPPVLSDAEELEEYPGGVTMRVKKSRAGRKPTYKPEYAKIAAAMLKKDALISELAEMFGVTNKTIYQWRHIHKEFGDAFCEMGPDYDARIERTLAERAMGYTYDAVKIFQFQGQPVVVPYQEHVPPDVNALKFWLAARNPDRWRQREELEVSTNETFLEIWRKLGDKPRET